MASVKSFEELDVWKRARILSQKIFEISNLDGFNSDFTLKNQINGAAGSIMDNIAEGFERGGKNEFIQFLFYSKGSAGEVRSQLYRALDRKYIVDNKFEELKEEVLIISRMILKFANYLRQSDHRGIKYISEPVQDYGLDSLLQENSNHTNPESPSS